MSYWRIFFQITTWTVWMFCCLCLHNSSKPSYLNLEYKVWVVHMETFHLICTIHMMEYQVLLAQPRFEAFVDKGSTIPTKGICIQFLFGKVRGRRVMVIGWILDNRLNMYSQVSFCDWFWFLAANDNLLNLFCAHRCYHLPNI